VSVRAPRTLGRDIALHYGEVYRAERRNRTGFLQPRIAGCRKAFARITTIHSRHADGMSFEQDRTATPHRPRYG